MWEQIKAWLEAHSVETVAAVLTALLFALIKPLRDKLFKVLGGGFAWLIAFLRSIPSHLALRGHVLADRPLWQYRRPRAVALDNAPPTLTIMNFKGGVGKTTLAANLAASMALHRGLRVLLIDLDYQGSLSELLRPSTASAKQFNLVASMMGKVGRNATWDQVSVPAAELANVRLISADYALTDGLSPAWSLV